VIGGKDAGGELLITGARKRLDRIYERLGSTSPFEQGG